jgi:hypothetical protein
MQRCYILAVLLCFLTSSLLANQDSTLAFRNGKELSRWISTYYLSPQPERLTAAINTFAANENSMQRIERLDPMVHFFAAAISTQPQIQQQLKASNTRRSGNAKEFVDRIVRKGKHFSTPVANDPNDLDVLWSEFYATGKALPVEHITNVLALKADAINLDTKFWQHVKISEKSKALELLHSSATWSISQNAKNHQTVLAVLKSISADENKDNAIRDKVKGIIAPL